MMFGTLAPEGFLTRLGWIVFDGLWQGLALAVILALALRCARWKTSVFRHGLALTTLVIWLAVPPAGLLVRELRRPISHQGIETKHESAEHVGPALATLGGAAESGSASLAGLAGWARVLPVERLARFAAPIVTRPDGLLPLIGLSWLAVSGALLLRLLASLVVAVRIGRSGRPLPELEGRLADLRSRLGLPKPVAIRESSRVDAPTVIGGRRPLLLLPRGARSAMPDDQLVLVLTHELAHLKRKDGLVNLLLATAEVALPFHPFTWWVGAVIRLEREQACDDLAVATTGSEPLALARALARLEGARVRPPMLLTAGGNPGHLVRRVRRLLGQPVTHNSLRAALPFVGIGLLASWASLGDAQEARTLPAAGVPIVAIDAGHGGGTGAIGYVDEEAVVLQVAVKLADLLDANGVRTVLTRSGPDRLSDSIGDDLTSRLAIAASADVLVSLHANAGNAFLRGVQTWTPAPGPDATLTARLLASSALAEVVHPRLVAATGAPDRGLRSRGSYLLDRASVPAVMFELGFVTHAEEGPLLASEEYQAVLAKALADGIIEYLAHRHEETDSDELPPASSANPFPLVLTYEELGL